MSVSFKILWIEDEEDWVSGAKEKVENYLFDHAFNPNVVNHHSGSDIENELNRNHYDLVLMDYNLADDERGTDVIRNINTHNLLVDIIFYSSNFDEMIKSAQEATPPLQGVYFADRGKEEEFFDKISNVINMIIRRSEDVQNLRGMIMDQFSDFETRVRSILIKIKTEHYTTEEQSTLLESLKTKTSEDSEKHKTDLEAEFAKEDGYVAVVDHDILLSCHRRLGLLDSGLVHLRDIGAIESSSILLTVSEKLRVLNSHRNRLAHVKADRNNYKIGNETFNIDQELHKKLREDINDVDRLLAELEEVLLAKEMSV